MKNQKSEQERQNQKLNLVIALTQVESLVKLLEGNEYKKHFYQHLIPIQVELNRQLSHYG
jgi:hypothetical protein